MSDKLVEVSVEVSDNIPEFSAASIVLQPEPILYLEMDEEELPEFMEILYERIDSIPKNEHGTIKGKLSFNVIFYPDE